MRLITFLSCLLVVGLGGCASRPVTVSFVPFAPLSAPPEAARLYLFHPDQEGATKGAVEFYVNDRSLATLEVDTYIHFVLKPGRYRIAGKKHPGGWLSPVSNYVEIPPAEFVVQPGMIYYMYPITVLKKREQSSIAAEVFGTAIGAGLASALTGVPYYPTLRPNVYEDAGRYWRFADQNTPDAYVDRLKYYRPVEPSQRIEITPLADQS